MSTAIFTSSSILMEAGADLGASGVQAGSSRKPVQLPAYKGVAKVGGWWVASILDPRTDQTRWVSRLSCER